MNAALGKQKPSVQTVDVTTVNANIVALSAVCAIRRDIAFVWPPALGH